MQWNELLDETRVSGNPLGDPEEWNSYNISEFEKDYRQIVASAPVRRLQDKTQVFPLDQSDFIRTRLTHSLEVSMIAKELGDMVCTYLLSEDLPSGVEEAVSLYPLDAQQARHISEVLMCAGLLHDLGNPSYGHFGEEVIGDWFREHLKEIKFNDRTLSEVLGEGSAMAADLEHFEGNAQTLRLLLKAAGQGSGDMDLTWAVVHTLMKYPVDSLSFDHDADDIKRHKNGFFQAEKEKLEAAAGRMGTLSDDGIVRHPLTFLLEAADDIAYATADLEDAFKKGLFTLEQFVAFYEEDLGRRIEKERSQGHTVTWHQENKPKELIRPLRNEIGRNEGRTPRADAACFNQWVKLARGWLMYCAAYAFTRNYRAIMEGTYTRELPDAADGFHRLTVKVLKKAMGKFVYHTKNVASLELSAQTIMWFLLDRLVPAALYKDDEDRQTKAGIRYMDLISSGFKDDYENSKTGDEAQDLYLRLLMVTDFVSGMTDSYAKSIYQKISAIS